MKLPIKTPAATGGKPLSLFDRLRAAVVAPDQTVADLERAVNDANQARDAALAASATLEAQRADMLLAPDAERAAYKTQLAETVDRATDLAAFASRIGQRLAAARAAEEQARRRVAYEGAQYASAAYARTFERDYRAAVTSLLALLREGAQIAVSLEAVNAALPDGAAALPHPEILAREVTGTPEKVIDQREVELWARIDDMARPLSEEFQSSVHPMGNGWGKMRNDLQPTLRKATYRKITVREAVYPAFPGFLAGTLQLPAPRGAGLPGSQLWELRPWLANDPGAVLADVAAAEFSLQAVPEPIIGKTKVIFEMIRADLPSVPEQVVENAATSRVIQNEYMEREARLAE